MAKSRKSMMLNHLICDACWTQLKGSQEPRRLADTTARPCCYCGQETTSGIIIRDANPTACNCEGPVHEGAEAS